MIIRAPVAQLDRALASGARGHKFESCRAYQNSPYIQRHAGVAPQAFSGLTPCSAEFLSIYRPFCPLSVHSVHCTYERPLRSGGSIRRDTACTKRTEALKLGCAGATAGTEQAAIRCA